MTFEEWWLDAGGFDDMEGWCCAAYRAGQEEMRAEAATAKPDAATADELRNAIVALPLEGDDD